MSTQLRKEIYKNAFELSEKFPEQGISQKMKGLLGIEQNRENLKKYKDNKNMVFVRVLGYNGIRSGGEYYGCIDR